MLSPILSHTAEETWQMLPGATQIAPSVELAAFPETDSARRDDDLAARWRVLLSLRDEVNRALENARRTGTVKKSLEAKVTLSGAGASEASAGFSDADLATLFLVSQVERRPEGASDVEVGPAEGRKCVRCWLVRRDIGADPAHPDLCSRCTDALAHRADAQRTARNAHETLPV